MFEHPKQIKKNDIIYMKTVTFKVEKAMEFMGERKFFI